MAGGLQIVTQQNIYETIRQVILNAGFKQPEQFVTDPSKSPPQQPKPNPEMLKIQNQQQKDAAALQLEQQRHQLDIQQRSQEQAQQAQIEQHRNELEAQREQLKAQNEAQIRQYEADQKARSDADKLEFEKWKEALHAELALTLAQISASKATDATTTETVDQSATALATALQGITAVLQQSHAPKQIIHDANGRPIGIAPV
jgi:septin family protein